MTTPQGPYEFRISVGADSPQEESEIVKAIASEFIRLGVGTVCVIADGEHINYIDGEVKNTTDDTLGLFRVRSDELTAAYVRSHQSIKLN